MAGQRTAGYCSHCNRGVTIVRPQKSGLMEKMRSALSQADDDSNWVCTKCGEPARRGFAPPPTEIPVTADTLAAAPESSDTTQAVADRPGETTETPQPAQQTAENSCPTCNQPFPENSQTCAACAKPPVERSSPEATCHLCHNPIAFTGESAHTQINCPTCKEPVVLPGTEHDISALTSPPAIMKLEDIPDRPEISKALCTLCQFELTYPKRLTGKNVDCPSCSVNFILP